MPTWSKLSPGQQKRELDEIIRRKLRKSSTMAASVPVVSAGSPRGGGPGRVGSR